jgi:hypothetical protein
MKNGNKRRAKRKVADDLRLASDIHRTRLSRQQTVQVANMRRPGGYYGTPLPDEIDKPQAAYVDGKGRAVQITPENVGEVSRFAAGRSRRQHSRMMSMDSQPSTRL